jgi:hypothetical protein
MNVKSALLALLCAGVALAGPSGAQTGHPAKGTWLGYWGPDEDTQRRIVLHLDWAARQVVGEVNPGPNESILSRAEIDYDTWTMTLEAELPAADGGAPERWVAVGKLENLGSWTNRRYSGTYTHGEEAGEFRVTLN